MLRVMSDQPPIMRGPRADPKLDQISARVTADARQHWDEGYTHFFLSIQATDHSAHLLQWVESIGWVLEHAGWVWAEKGYVGYGGFGLLNSAVVGNYLFGRPGGARSLTNTLPDDGTPQRRDM
jgi:hypothetical protein